MDAARIEKIKELKALTRKDFNKAALHYDKYAQLQKEVAASLYNTASHALPKNAFVLDAGCGTGYLAQLGNSHWNMVQCDIAEAMCEKAAAFSPAVAADVEMLPFKDDSFDAVLSSLTYQWVQLLPTFSEAHRVLKPGGKIIATTLGEETLKELRRSFVAAVGVAPVIRFFSNHKIESRLAEAGFKNIEVESAQLLVDYKDIYTLLSSIKGIGGRYKQGRSKQGISRKYFEEIAAAYKRFFGDICATWEIHYLKAEK